MKEVGPATGPPVGVLKTSPWTDETLFLEKGELVLSGFQSQPAKSVAVFNLAGLVNDHLVLSS